jgi:Bacterial transcriptional regulator
LISRGKITKLTDRTMMDPRRLEDELNKIRRLGYATSDGEAIRGTIGIAVPVWNSMGQVEAALALTAVESLCNMKQLMRFLPNLKRTAENISKALGYDAGKKILLSRAHFSDCTCMLKVYNSVQHTQTTIIDTQSTSTIKRRKKFLRVQHTKTVDGRIIAGNFPLRGWRKRITIYRKAATQRGSAAESNRLTHGVRRNELETDRN